eukprot:352902-Chlamydomonas_euryale.AAC.4
MDVAHIWPGNWLKPFAVQVMQGFFILCTQLKPGIRNVYEENQDSASEARLPSPPPPCSGGWGCCCGLPHPVLLFGQSMNLSFTIKACKKHDVLPVSKDTTSCHCERTQRLAGGMAALPALPPPLPARTPFPPFPTLWPPRAERRRAPRGAAQPLCRGRRRQPVGRAAERGRLRRGP